ncbi:hypothetical protein HELRODRAFT_190953 [Helobdella robusta]|uniref:Cullin-2 n=1 Tax=Helobdella robusta TaxID=6412 RepID=T1FSG4_HELRO|nr:hypothetical protein HELRODRAFT_190953 [Helobdella robusta]ESO08238.1 hypothetical protein HELRODRAFT_190953 [Helobdella robusta]
MSLKPKQVDFEDLWPRILDVVEKVLAGRTVEKSVWNDRFTDVYALCVSFPEALAERLYAKTKEFIENHVLNLSKSLEECSEDVFLETYNSHWLMYSRGCGYLNQLFGYLNTQYIPKLKIEIEKNFSGLLPESDEKLLEIEELSYNIWRTHLLENCKHQLTSLILRDINLDRIGSGLINQSTIQGAILSFVHVRKHASRNSLDYYQKNFEKEMLLQTSEHYQIVARKHLDTCTCSEYMTKALQMLDEETMRSKKFFHATSQDKVLEVFRQRVVADHMSFMHQSSKLMVKTHNKIDLSNMYNLLHSVQDGLNELIEQIEMEIGHLCTDVICRLDGDNMAQQFVESLLEVHNDYTQLIQEVFKSDQQFITALDKAFNKAVNQSPQQSSGRLTCVAMRSPELLAKYCDNLLKRGGKTVNEYELDEKLQASITIFKYLNDKDVFNKFYARMLAKRLIYFQSQSMDAEESMINRLKQVCGYEFTNKLHRMFTDISISADLASKFTSFNQSRNVDLGLGFTILVLQAGAWPIGQQNITTFCLPQELEKPVHMFEKFYAKNFTGRKLTWVYAFSQCEVKVCYLARPYFISMATYLMSLLLPFNSADCITRKELEEHTGIPEKELLKNLQALLDVKFLIADHDKDGLCENTIFKLNVNYSNKKTKFKIMTAQKESNQEIVEQTRSSVNEDRKIYLQAAIVRIMKARKVFKHNLLVKEVISQSLSKFTPSISLIKKSIETLIDKQYIERTPNAADEYVYLA